MENKTKKSSSNFGVGAFILILIIAMISVFTGIYIGKAIYPPVGGTYVSMIDNMIVSIPDSNLHVKMGIAFETKSRKQSELIEDNKLIIEEQINRIVQELDEAQAKDPLATETLKEKIKTYLDLNFSGASVLAIYFNDYVTQ